MCNRDNLAAVFPFAAIGFTGAILMAKQMDILALGDDTASSLGIPVFRSRLLLLLFSALLAASAVSLAGLMGFIGLIVPHALRLILKSFSNRKLLTYSAICGAVLLTLCDTIGRTVAAPAEIPAGIVTALLGPPFFFYLLFRKGSSL